MAERVTLKRYGLVDVCVLLEVILGEGAENGTRGRVRSPEIR
jgi:hypothetical protein